MRPFVTFLMLLACLLYGFMPAMAAQPWAPPAPAGTAMTHPARAHEGQHAHHADEMPVEDAAAIGDPCPHRGGSAHAPFCAACLVLPPFIAASAQGKSPFSYPAPGLAAAFAAAIPAPADPPPRA